MKPQSLLPSLLNISRRVGKRILAVYQSGDFAKELKSDLTPVTSADIEAHRMLIAELAKLTPDLPVLSEEDADIPLEIRQAWPCYWLVDPLDGTQEFISGTGEFATSIALIVDHKPIMGVVYYPMKNTAYYAIKQQGAWKQVGEDKPNPLSVIEHEASDRTLTVTISRRQNKIQTSNCFSEDWHCDFVYFGSASLKSCLVAEGNADCYLRLGITSEWDTAAVQCIVEEAGGELLDLNWRPLTYNLKPSLQNPNFIVMGDKNLPWRNILS